MSADDDSLWCGGFDLLPDAAMSLDGDGTILASNREMRRLTGFSDAELSGRNWITALRPRTADGTTLTADDVSRRLRLRSVLRLPEREMEIHGRDGQPFRVSMTASLQRDDHGALTGAVVCMRPAPRHNTATTTGIDLISTVSHELRSPLTSVKGYAGLLLNRWDRLGDDEKIAMLGQINDDAERVMRLVGELLDVSRLELGRLGIHPRPFELAVLVERVAERARLVHPGLALTVSLEDSLPVIVADADRIEQVLTNLIDNAARYAGEDEVRVHVRRRDERVLVEVSDRGPGMSPSVARRVFEKFFRSPDAGSSGSGLGLWISRGLVEAHGGTLSVDSVLGEGSTFRFDLPIRNREEMHGS